jgi:type II secretion system protein G
MKKRGFTLIELLVVIAIIGLLSTLSVVSLNSARGKARDAARKSDMNSISTAMELYNVEEGSYPVTAAACAGNVLALATGHVVCSGQSIATTNDTLLQSIPEPPVASDYIGWSDGDDYCISAVLEATTGGTDDIFKCVNGSCFLADAGCTSVTN